MARPAVVDVTIGQLTATLPGDDEECKSRRALSPGRRSIKDGATELQYGVRLRLDLRRHQNILQEVHRET
jgi:hypothetical protein